MRSYLSSFGPSPATTESEKHKIFKRSSSPRKRKFKKVSTTTTPETPRIVAAVPTKPLEGKDNGKNFTVSPRHIVKFELDDAKYNEEYEKLKQSRKLRVKRSADGGVKKNDTKRSEKLATKESFIEPREFFRFSYSDAVTKVPEKLDEAQEIKDDKERKTKREIADSTATESKNIHVSHPMRGYRSTTHVSYDDVSSKLQKMIDSALRDAVVKGKASDGDYLKFFYGDKIIKVPVSMSKYVSSKSKKAFSHPQESSSLKPPQLLGTKNSYYPVKSSDIKYDSKVTYVSPVPSTTEKAESYVNFETPISVEPEIQEEKYASYKKSVYYYTNDENYYPKNSVSSPGPVLFDEPTTPTSSIDISNTHHYKNFIYHPPTKVTIVKDAIPITEHVDETYEYIPTVSVPEKSHLSIPEPTSYVEYAGNHADSHDHHKNYEFGYVFRRNIKR